MKSQKEYVIDKVIEILPTFVKFQNNALLMLTKPQLEVIKSCTSGAIQLGTVEYSKDRTNGAEVNSYARSMVMNHLKKAKELNGGVAYQAKSSNSESVNTQSVKVLKVRTAPKGVNTDILPEDLKEYVKSLI